MLQGDHGGSSRRTGRWGPSRAASGRAQGAGGGQEGEGVVRGRSGGGVSGRAATTPGAAARPAPGTFVGRSSRSSSRVPGYPCPGGGTNVVDERSST
ncbi:hypothetical protein [Ornithinimicrobium kibberense]|uniref:hypothetical protein n=1 Tax=Ornithinimicrobium kibberense TaxID=282060 RepID=UPI0036110BCE